MGFPTCPSSGFLIVYLANAFHEIQYAGWNAVEAVKDYLRRISVKIPHFESMEEPDLDYIKVRARFENPSTKVIEASNSMPR